MTQEIQGIRNVTKNYGSRDTEMKYGGRVYGENLIKTATWTFNYDELPSGGASNLEMSIPANSTIVSARLRVLTAFTSTSTTTDFNIGLEQADGTDIDSNGLIGNGVATQTAIAVVGNLITGTGALINSSIGPDAGELMVIPNVDDLLTGRGEVIIEYMTPAALPA